MLATLVIGLVAGAIIVQRLGQRRNRGVDIRLCRIEVDHQRPDLGAQEMVGAGRAKRCEVTQLAGVDELQHGIAIVEMTKLAHALLRDHAADAGHQPCCNGAALGSRQRFRRCTTEDGFALGLAFEPADRLVDGVDGDRVAFFRRVTPGEQAMAFEHHALGCGIFQAEFFQPEPELEARALPRQPADLVAEYPGGQRL